MIRYALVCERGHEFESWFQDSTAYDKQAKQGLVSCAQCGSVKVEKAIMAPRLSATVKKQRAPVGLCGGGNVYRCGWPGDPGCGFVAISCAMGCQGSPRHRRGMATLAFCGVYGGFRVGILVSGLCDHDRSQCANAGVGRGSVRARGDAFRIQAANHAARGSRHRACCDWCCATGVVALVPLVRQYRQGMEFDAFLGQLFCFLRRSDAVDRAMLYLSIVHLARFLWKFWADIVRVLG